LSPFLTLQHAVDNTTAGGEVSFVDTGDYGDANINRSITIDGGGVRGGVNFSDAYGLQINAGPTDQIVLRNLDISGNGVGQNGIFVFAGFSVTIDNCTIKGCTTDGVGIQRTITDTEKVLISNTTITGGFNSIHTIPSAFAPQVTVSRCFLSGASNAGLDCRNGTMDVANTTVTHMPNFAVYADTSSFLRLIGSTVSQSGIGASAFSATITLSNDSLFDNSTELGLGAGGTIQTLQNNARAGGTAGSTNATATTF